MVPLADAFRTWLNAPPRTIRPYAAPAALKAARAVGLDVKRLTFARYLLRNRILNDDGP